MQGILQSNSNITALLRQQQKGWYIGVGRYFWSTTFWPKMTCVCILYTYTTIYVPYLLTGGRKKIGNILSQYFHCHMVAVNWLINCQQFDSSLHVCTSKSANICQHSGQWQWGWVDSTVVRNHLQYCMATQKLDVLHTVLLQLREILKLHTLLFSIYRKFLAVILEFFKTRKLTNGR